MEPLPEPASRPRPGPRPRCLLLLPLLLLLLLLLAAPELGPRQARAEETDWVRLPSKCEGEGVGLEEKRRGIEGPGLSSGSPLPEPAMFLALCWMLGTQGRARVQVSVHLELRNR